MDAEWLDRARQLRAEAWEAVQSSSAYVAYKHFDDLVVEMGGTSTLSEGDASASWKTSTQRAVEAAARRLTDQKKPSQGDAAEFVLRQARKPLPIGHLFEAAIERGAAIGGSDPLANFRSAVSKDNRFYTLRRGNGYFWWLRGEPVPAAYEGQSPDSEAHAGQPHTPPPLDASEGGMTDDA